MVFTNVVNDQLPIEGSKELRCSLPELFSIVKSADLVVATRSGALDFIIQSGINMFVLYSNNEKFKAIYDLNAWQCGGNIKEVIQRDIENDTNLTIFKQFLSEIESGGKWAPAETD